MLLENTKWQNMGSNQIWLHLSTKIIFLCPEIKRLLYQQAINTIPVTTEVNLPPFHSRVKWNDTHIRLCWGPYGARAFGSFLVRGYNTDVRHLNRVFSLICFLIMLHGTLFLSALSTVPLINSSTKHNSRWIIVLGSPCNISKCSLNIMILNWTLVRSCS